MARTPEPAASTTGPRLNLPIFLLALFGVLVVVHLWVQQRADFAFGCTGAGDAASGSGCAEVTSSVYSDFLGVSLLVWGALFYLLVAALRFGIASAKPPTSETLRTASLAVVSVGFLFVLYLVGVQAFALGEFCVLCLLSSLTVAVLFALHLVERAKGPGPAVRMQAALRPYLIGAVALVVLAGADVLLADRSDAPVPVAATSNGVRPGSSAQPVGLSAECHYDLETPRLRVFDQLITMQTPYHGDPEAPVRAVKIFDPNCPHCRNAHRTLSTFTDAMADEAVFYYHPHMLWEHSTPQIQALMIAQEQGKFFEMLDGQFGYQENFVGLHRIRQGNEAQWLDGVLTGLTRIAGEIGMDAEALEQEIRARKYVGLIQQQARMVQEAGVRSVPRLVIEGDVMANTTSAWSRDCIGGLVEQHLPADAPAADVPASDASVPSGS